MTRAPTSHSLRSLSFPAPRLIILLCKPIDRARAIDVSATSQHGGGAARGAARCPMPRACPRAAGPRPPRAAAAPARPLPAATATRGTTSSTSPSAATRAGGGRARLHQAQARHDAMEAAVGHARAMAGPRTTRMREREVGAGCVWAHADNSGRTGEVAPRNLTNHDDWKKKKKKMKIRRKESNNV